MENRDFYISPYGKRKEEPKQLGFFLISFLIGAMITAFVLCALAMYLQGR